MQKMKSRNWIVKTVLSAALSATVLSAGMVGSASAKELLYSLIAPNHPLNKPVFGVWADNIAKATDGRVTVRMLDTAAAPPPRLYDAIRTGIADAGHAFIGFLGAKAPLMQIGMLPMIANSAEANAVALARTYEKYIKEKEQLEGVKIMGFLSNPGGIMCSLKDPIDSSAALKSLKMWSLPGYAAKAMEAMGVPVVAGPATEMYALISKGTVDGFNGVSIGDAFAFKTAQYAKSCTVVEGGVFTPIFAVLINQGTWDALPAEDQKAIESVSGEAFARLSGAVDEWNTGNLKAYTDQGGVLVTPSAEFQGEMKAAWAPMSAAWVASATAAGLDGQAIFDYYQEQVKAVEAE